jgi:hypothetical protein
MVHKLTEKTNGWIKAGADALLLKTVIVFVV